MFMVGVAANDKALNPDRRLTILHVTAPAAVGGLERVVQALAEGHQAGGHAVHVAVSIAPDEVGSHPFVKTLRELNLGVHLIPVAARAYTRERAAIAELCRTLRPDVVHTHGYRSDVVAGGIPRRFRIPTVSTVHGFTRVGFRGRLYEWAQRRAYRNFDAVVAVSGPQVAELVAAGVARERIHLVQNAWAGRPAYATRESARSELGALSAAVHVGWVGRVSPEKGPDVFLDAMAHLKDLSIHASIVGDGAVRSKLERQANLAGLGGRVHWQGMIPDAHRLFPAFDVFVISSRTEGTPIVLFEAMAAGVPIVATRVGGIPDVVSEREALLVPPENPLALAQAVRLAGFTDVVAAQSRAGAARRRLDKDFGVAPWLASYESLYRQLSGTVYPSIEIK